MNEVPLFVVATHTPFAEWTRHRAVEQGVACCAAIASSTLEVKKLIAQARVNASVIISRGLIPLKDTFENRDAADEAGTGDYGFFRYASSVGHSCVPNASASWSRRNGRLLLISISDIQAGSEIVVDYIKSVPELTNRRHILQTYFDIDCTCRLCNESDDSEYIKMASVCYRVAGVPDGYYCPDPMKSYDMLLKCCLYLKRAGAYNVDRASEILHAAERLAGCAGLVEERSRLRKVTASINRMMAGGGLSNWKLQEVGLET